MLAMPMVRPTLASDLVKLEQEFVHGYREGAHYAFMHKFMHFNMLIISLN
jgi:hypothetical protein